MAEQTGNPVVLIKATHPWGYRYGHAHPWGIIQGVTWKNDRPVYVVYFPQGNVWDFWPVHDEADPYEFKQAS